MTKELIDQLWNQATRQTLQNGELNERYQFAKLVAAHEHKSIAAMVKPLDESLVDEILARGNNA
jgi:hypothetical protein